METKNTIPESFEKLFDHFAKYISLTKNEQLTVAGHFHEKKIAKKEFLLKEGEVCLAHCFVLSGCFRLFLITENGAEQIMQFAISGWWLSDFYSFDNQIPSGYYIQAIEDSKVAIISKPGYDALFERVPQMNRYFRKMMQIGYTTSLKKMEIMICQSAEERYHDFNNAFPDFVQRIPQYMLASFLGFTPGFLSMLRAKRKQMDKVLSE